MTLLTGHRLHTRGAARLRLDRPRLLVAVALLSALGWGGCFSSCDESAPAAHAPAAGVASEATEPSAAPLTDPETQVARGEAIVQFEDGRATVLANQYPRLGLLGKLSRQAGFEQQRTRSSASPGDEVTVRVVDGTLEQAIAAILSGQSYHLHYRPEQEGGPTRLAGVTVGDLDARARARNQHVARNRGDRPRSREELRQRAADLRDREEDVAERSREIELGLASDDEQVRAEAVDRMKPEGSELDRLKQLLAGDPSAVVRSTAAERLEGGTGSTAVDALIAALGDPEPKVVLAAIDALEFAAEPDNIPAIQQSGVASHPDPEVREAYIEMLEFVAE